MKIFKFSGQKVPIFFPFLPFFHPISLSYLGESKISLFSIRVVPKKHELAYLTPTLVLFISLIYKKNCYLYSIEDIKLFLFKWHMGNCNGA